LVHEALHALNNVRDTDLAKNFGLYTEGMTEAAASVAFQKWLNDGCQRPQ
jgi:hypothetical protein